MTPKLFLLLPFNILFFISVYSQEKFIDTIPKIYESERNYLGINLSPIFNVFANNNPIEKVKISSIYKKNFGKLNARFSLNYLSNPQSNFFQSPISSSDSSITYKLSYSNYNHFDFRFGFEELRYLSSSRFHIGLDGIIGYGKQISRYTHEYFLKDSIGNYLTSQNNLITNNEGNISYNYFISGIDLSFGMDFFLSESILLTLQLTPQFNYWIVNQNSIYINHLNGEFENYGNNYADFKLGYFDLLLIYKF